jgi:DNA modification methylase
MNITNGDCLELMKNLPDKSIDLFICDLPYGETNCKWDSVIDLEEFWIQFKRLRKSKRTACIHFCSTKFGYTLIKSNEKMFKMDMVWKKRNKTGGLQSRNRPMRNHEMVYFFYEQAPQYNRDKYHKRIQPKKEHNIEKEDLTMGTTHKMKDTMHKCFEPPNPASIVEEKPLYKTSKYTENVKKGFGYETGPGIQKDKKGDARFPLTFDPPNPASIVEETEDVWGQSKFSCGGDCGRLNEDGSYKLGYEPPNPASVYESTKVFIGKRHHQTEKPQDILEFFIKYWSDEGHTILDPTMGSGSTGVACKTLKRNFIGYEKDEKIFKVAENRIKKVEVII